MSVKLKISFDLLVQSFENYLENEEEAEIKDSKRAVKEFLFNSLIDDLLFDINLAGGKIF